MNNEEFLNILKVINDATRLTIINMLSKKECLCGCKLLEELQITQSTLSHHMKVLTQAGLVSCKRNGKWCHYYLNKEKLSEVKNYLENITK